MFGAFRCSEDAGKNLEFVDLSGNSTVDARNYTMLREADTEAKSARRVISAEIERCVKSPVQQHIIYETKPDLANGQKLKCSGDQYGCQRCRTTSTTCTYRSSGKSSKLPSSKRRPSTSELRSSSKSPKKQQTRTNADCRPAVGEAPSNASDKSRPLLSMDLNDGFWTSMTPSGSFFHELVHGGDDPSSKEPQSLNLNLSEDVNTLPGVFQLPEYQDSPSQSTAIAVSITNDNPNNFVLTPPATANPSATSEDLSGYRSRGCSCIRSMADVLERVSGDKGSDIDESDRFDDLLVHLRDGVEACKKALSCKYCSVCTTNSMFIVTIIQQLASIAQKLCLQLLAYQQNVKTTSRSDEPLLLGADIFVGRYQVRAEALNLGFLFPIVSIHVEDLGQLLEHLRDEVKRGTKASKLLSAAVDMVQTASSDLPLTFQKDSRGTKTSRRPG